MNLRAQGHSWFREEEGGEPWGAPSPGYTFSCEHPARSLRSYLVLQ